MADVVFNVALGKVGYYSTLPAANDALIVLLLKESGLQADDALRDHNTLAALLADTNDEATFTNYARKTITSVTETIDDTGNVADDDFADQTWSSAGGASNNDIGKALVCYDPDTTGGTDSSIIPLTAHDYVATTDGTDLIVQLNAAGYFRAQPVA